VPLKGVSILEVDRPDSLEPALELVRRSIEEPVGSAAGAERFAAAERFVRGALGERSTLLLLAQAPGAPPLGVLFAADAGNPFLGTAVPFLYALYVRPESRRAGVAAALLGRAEGILRARGLRSLSVDVPYQDDARISMGERRGYVREREWMTKDL
jgi:GNAT superfamily N-acetyltransferase